MGWHKSLPEYACITVEVIIDTKVSSVSTTTSNFPWPQNFCHTCMASFKSIKLSLRLACTAADLIPYTLSRGILSTPSIKGLNSWHPNVRGSKSGYCFTISFAFPNIFLMFRDTHNAECVEKSGLRCYSMVSTYPIVHWWLQTLSKNSSKLGRHRDRTRK